MVESVLANCFFQHSKFGVEPGATVVRPKVQADKYMDPSLVGCCEDVWQHPFDGVCSGRVKSTGHAFYAAERVGPVGAVLYRLVLAAIPCSEREAAVDARLLRWVWDGRVGSIDVEKWREGYAGSSKVERGRISCSLLWLRCTRTVRIDCWSLVGASMGTGQAEKNGK